MGQPTIDFSKYKGWMAVIRGYIAEHSMLVLSVQRQLGDTGAEYILCDWCKQLPSKFTWQIDDLKAWKLDENRWLLTDWKERIFVPCAFVRQREGFDLKRWLGGGDSSQGEISK